MLSITFTTYTHIMYNKHEVDAIAWDTWKRARERAREKEN
nr:MAG TPA: hypothetical protein [Caudoviricetes sp.]